MFLLADPNFLLGRRNFAPISLSYRDPHFGLFGGFWGYLATSDAKSDVIFLLSDPGFLLGRRNFAPISLSYRDPHFGLFGGFGRFWGPPVYPNWPKIESGRPMVTPHLSWKFRANRSSRFLVTLLTKKQRNKQTKKERKKSSENNTPLLVPTGGGVINKLALWRPLNVILQIGYS